MSWCIVADSSCNLRSFDTQSEAVSYSYAPLKIHVGSREFVDDDSLDIDELNRAVAAEQQASSSACPSAGEWAREFKKADNVIAITISGTISGSFEAAQMARDMILEECSSKAELSHVKKSIYIHDSKSAGPKLEILVTLIVRYLNAYPNATFDEAVSYIQAIDGKMQILFSLSHYDNLVKSGRLPKVAGNIASKLNIRIMGTASDEGTIKVCGSTRGEAKSFKKIIERMRDHGFHGGMVYIDHMNNRSGAERLRELIVEAWPTSEVTILPCDGLCSYYAEETGLIVGYEWLD